MILTHGIALYDELNSFANYGPMYRRINKCYIGRGPGGALDALVEIRGSGKDIPKYAMVRADLISLSY